MNTTHSPSLHSALGADAPTAGKRALVLGGGGSTGNAWLIGVIAGLQDAGVNAAAADLIVGTSAGSTAAAQITGADPADLLAAILDAGAPPPRQAAGGPVSGAQAAAPVLTQMERTAAVIAAAADAADMRRRMGASALEAVPASSASTQARWRATVASRLPSLEWPERRLLITAVDARTGDPVVFDRHSGVDLVDAVAASCSSGAPYNIGDGRYIDGGYRTNADNADLAAGYAHVLVLSPFSGRSRTPVEWGLHLATQVDALRAGGSTVEAVFPDSGSAHLFGPNAMDLSLRLPAARAGFNQGRALAGRLARPFTSGQADPTQAPG
ncbi:patatin-like phospholipase family protein [Pseudarthrobacter sp. MEB009]|uniref:patatin-like phospholipase family protein n=1 Tax=Pseudarthrobacter sp. MEB009 TaxID=3040326 RepID=UPI002554C23C|nr:patatin-like phospholipase family protein [Pseudarthrobacter sp. MEB009]